MAPLTLWPRYTTFRRKNSCIIIIIDQPFFTASNKLVEYSPGDEFFIIIVTKDFALTAV